MKRNKNEPSHGRGMTWGILIIILGVVFLLSNLNIFSLRDHMAFWPLFLIAVGGIKLSQAHQQGSNYGLGLGLVLAGVGASMHQIGMIHFHMRDWWPLFLVFIGVMMVSKGFGFGDGGKQRGQSQEPKSPGTDGTQQPTGTGGGNAVDGLPADGKVSLAKEATPGTAGNPSGGADSGPDSPPPSGGTDSGEPETVDVESILSGTILQRRSQNFRGGELSTILGSINLDLRQASIQSQARLKVSAIWGSIEIKVPADWTVVLDCSSILAASEDRTMPPIRPTKRLVVSGNLVMAGIVVKN